MVHAETGSFAELKQAEAKGQACGYPPLVTLQLQDGILQCQPLHVAAEKGQIAIVQVNVYSEGVKVCRHAQCLLQQL